MSSAAKLKPCALERKASCKIDYAPKLQYLPMGGDVAEPLDAGGLEGDVGVEAAGDGAVDDGLPLLLQQRDELLLGADVAADAVVDVVEVADDGALFGEGWEGEANGLDSRVGKAVDRVTPFAPT